MKLSEFIEDALSEVALGIKKAKEKSRSVMAISPGTVDGKTVVEISYIDFDISLFVSESSESSTAKEKGISELKVFSVGINGNISANSESSINQQTQMTQKISFRVPVCMAADFDIK